MLSCCVNRSTFGGIALLLAIAATVVPSTGQTEPGKSLYVQHKSTKLRKEPKHWAPGVADLAHGDKLDEVEFGNAWYKVKNGAGQEGFVHESIVTATKIVLRGSGDVAVMAESSDIVLAGKGFNNDIESNYAGSDQSLNYAAVNEMEKLNVPPEEIGKFIIDGDLNQDFDRSAALGGKE